MPYQPNKYRGKDHWNYGKTPWNKGLKIETPWMKNRIVSSETRSKISKAGKNRKLSEEHKRKISVTLKSKHLKRSEETRRKMGWTKGTKFSLEHRKNLSNARLFQVQPKNNTSIEVKLQNWLKEQGIDFETHYPILGQPDIFIKPNICIFADGCYWHKCEQCGFTGENKRDNFVNQELQKQGYVVIRIWEHEIKNNSYESRIFSK